MKKIVCLLLALLMVIMAFASCAKNPDADENTTDAESKTDKVVETEEEDEEEKTTKGDATTEPEVTEPETTEPEITTEPETTEPEITTEPETTEPEITTEPETTEPEEETTEPETTEPEEETTEPEKQPAVEKSYSLSDFKIVYDADHNLDVAEKLRDEIKKKTGVELAVAKSSAGQNACEFVIGKTNRAVSTYCFDYKNNEYINCIGILCDNGKVQLLGIDKRTLIDSIDYVIDNILADGSATMTIVEEGALCQEIKFSSEKINLKADESQIRIVTNNILQDYIAKNTYKLPATQNRVIELIAFYSLIDADIIGFQEVDSGWYTNYNLKGEMAALGYTLVGNYTSIGCPIYYKTDRFELLDKGYASFDTTMFADGPYEARTYSWAVLEEKATGKQIMVSNSHFVWGWGSVNGASETAIGYRNESARQMLALVERMKTEYPEASAVVMGDLNSYLDSEVCSILGASMNFARETAKKKTNANYDSDMPKPGVKPSRSTTPKVIDHIYYTDGISAERYEVCISPYAYVFSDHVPVITDFTFN